MTLCCWKMEQRLMIIFTICICFYNSNAILHHYLIEDLNILNLYYFAVFDSCMKHCHKLTVSCAYADYMLIGNTGPY